VPIIAEATRHAWRAFGHVAKGLDVLEAEFASAARTEETSVVCAKVVDVIMVMWCFSASQYVADGRPVGGEHIHKMHESGYLGRRRSA
jgi:hypothetical protein